MEDCSENVRTDELRESAMKADLRIAIVASILALIQQLPLRTQTARRVIPEDRAPLARQLLSAIHHKLTEKSSKFAGSYSKLVYTGRASEKTNVICTDKRTASRTHSFRPHPQRARQGDDLEKPLESEKL
jgi:hypothetical protein